MSETELESRTQETRLFMGDRWLPVLPDQRAVVRFILQDRSHKWRAYILAKTLAHTHSWKRMWLKRGATPVVSPDTDPMGRNSLENLARFVGLISVALNANACGLGPDLVVRSWDIIANAAKTTPLLGRGSCAS